MFKLNQSKTFRWPVEVKLPADGGRFDAHEFDIDFNRLSQSRIVQILELIASGEAKGKDVTRELVAGWARVHDAEGKDIPFSSDALDRLLEVPGLGAAINDTFIQAIRGQKAKN